MRSFIIAAVLCASVVIGADSLPAKWQKRIDNAHTAYAAAVKKADDARFFAVQKANSDRLTVLKRALTDATKAGDFDAATILKAMITAAEKDGASRPKPENIVKFSGHEYAVIPDKVTWHVAKRMCEEMGGHLATLEVPEEALRIQNLCKTSDTVLWLGATDEVEEGNWKWVTGTPVQVDFRKDNLGGNEHYMVFWQPTNTLDDNGSVRHGFVCEWEN